MIAIQGKTQSKKHLVSLLTEVGEVFKFSFRKAKLLPVLSWQPQVMQEFFKKGESELPKPSYLVDKKMLDEVTAALDTIKPKLKGEHPVLQWLEKTRASILQGIQLVREIEKPTFYELSTQIYGNSGSALFNGKSTYIELARALASRMTVCNLDDLKESVSRFSASEFQAKIEKRVAKRNPPLDVRVEPTDQIVAKVVAGMNRVRIRADAKFSELELQSLWFHEIESHCLTAQNGLGQRSCDFLAAGGPRTTMTQEGLAVFHEVYGHSMSQNRFLTLCTRIEASKKVEDGADFLEVYRWFKSMTTNEVEAFYQTQRLFRGAPLTGKYPFTKDVVYLGGLLNIYHFLRVATKSQNRLLVESLICGRIALEDVGVVAWLRKHDILSPPKFMPRWLENWQGLLSYFSLAGVLDSLDLSQFRESIDDYAVIDDWDLV
jgi:uncharacterized protein (TIGR02421 family)